MTVNIVTQTETVLGGGIYRRCYRDRSRAKGVVGGVTNAGKPDDENDGSDEVVPDTGCQNVVMGQTLSLPLVVLGSCRLTAADKESHNIRLVAPRNEL